MSLALLDQRVWLLFGLMMCWFAAGAIWYPYLCEPVDKVAKWGLQTLLFWKQLRSVRAAGVSQCPMVILFSKQQEYVVVLRLRQLELSVDCMFYQMLSLQQGRPPPSLG
jgi:hypothetical protein